MNTPNWAELFHTAASRHQQFSSVLFPMIVFSHWILINVFLSSQEWHLIHYYYPLYLSSDISIYIQQCSIITMNHYNLYIFEPPMTKWLSTWSRTKIDYCKQSVTSHQYSTYYFWDKKQPFQGEWHDFTEEQWNPFQGAHQSWVGAHQSWVGILCLTILLFLFYTTEHLIKQSTSLSTTFKIYDIHLLTTFFQIRTSSWCPISIMFEGT